MSSGTTGSALSPPTASSGTAPTSPGMNRLSRTSKLADKLGIQNRAELSALQQFVDNPDQAPEEFLKSPAAKLNKLQSKLGVDETVQYAISSSSQSEAIKAIKLKKNAIHVKHISLSQELLDDSLESSSDPTPGSEGDNGGETYFVDDGTPGGGDDSTDPNGPPGIAGSTSGGTIQRGTVQRRPLATSGSMVAADGAGGAGGAATLTRGGGTLTRGGAAAADPQDLGSGSLTELANPRVQRTGTRMDKLADFFGAQDDHVGALRKIVSKSKGAEPQTARRNVKPTFLLRVHFANNTHMIVAMPLESSGHEIVSHVMRKLMIQDVETYYGLYLVDGQTNRILKDNDSVFDTVRNFTDGQYILFRRRGKADMSNDDEASAADKAAADLDPDFAELTGVAPSGGAGAVGATRTRKVVKLAAFFGVKSDHTAIQTGQAELEDLFNMLADSLIVDDGVGSHSSESTSLKRQGIKENTIFKEGWLTAEGGPGLTAETVVWVSVDRGTINVRYCESRETAISPRDPVHSTALASMLCEVPDKAKPSFVLRSAGTPDAVLFHFTSTGLSDRDDWVQVIQNLIAAAPARASDPGGAAKAPLADNSVARSTSQRSRSKSSRATIDDFEFHRVLGKGKYGKVLLCSHRVSKKVFAIKVIQRDQESEDTARTESEILRSIKHPFIVGLHFAFQNTERLYLVMEYVNGGELFFHLSQSGRFPEKRAKFYAAEIILALQCLHGKGIVYRDLKLENILLDKDGHIKIADFGLSRMSAKDDDKRTFSMAGTLEYFAPEVIEGINYSFPADWWAFGVILFELLCGYHPFYNPNPDLLYQLILRAPLEFPSFASRHACDLITRLLDRDYKKRLGSGKQGSREIQQHPFFKEFDFVKLFRKELPPPWRPDVADDFDVKFFDKEFTSEVIEDDDVKGAGN